MAEGWTVPKLWQGERCFVIAGGASAKWAFVDLARERGRRCLPDKVIAIKDAIFLQPGADLMFYSGRRLHKERPDIFEAWEYSGGPYSGLTVKRTVDTWAPRYVHQVRRAGKIGQKEGILGLSLDPATLGGWDSGGSAINLAFHLGAAEIILVGFDLAGIHWNPLHPYRRATPAQHEVHRLSIDAMAAPLLAAGVKCWNVSPISTLQEFPVAKITDLI